MSVSEPFRVYSSRVLRPGSTVCSEHIIIILNDSDYLLLGGREQKINMKFSPKVNLEDFFCPGPSSDPELFMYQT